MPLPPMLQPALVTPALLPTALLPRAPLAVAITPSPEPLFPALPSLLPAPVVRYLPPPVHVPSIRPPPVPDKSSLLLDDSVVFTLAVIALPRPSPSPLPSPAHVLSPWPPPKPDKLLVGKVPHLPQEDPTPTPAATRIMAVLSTCLPAARSPLLLLPAYVSLLQPLPWPDDLRALADDEIFCPPREKPSLMLTVVRDGLTSLPQSPVSPLLSAVAPPASDASRLDILPPKDATISPAPSPAGQLLALSIHVLPPPVSLPSPTSALSLCTQFGLPFVAQPRSLFDAPLVTPIATKLLLDVAPRSPPGKVSLPLMPDVKSLDMPRGGSVPMFTVAQVTSSLLLPRRPPPMPDESLCPLPDDRVPCQPRGGLLLIPMVARPLFLLLPPASPIPIPFGIKQT
ncbi:hypothetical protein AX14_009706 [Amanita brunnescens Koide BX004]|nr:hypothetical protein AX14_009706 [Amanita brunnescens Koide BX004]